MIIHTAISTRTVKPTDEWRAGRNDRIESVDVLRGLLMQLMAFDHACDYFSSVTTELVDPIHSWPAPRASLLFNTAFI